MPTYEEAQELVSPLFGKRCAVSVDSTLSELWAADLGHKLAIRFYQPEMLHALVLEHYEDYLREHGYVDEDGRWIHGDIVPFAPVGGQHDHEDLEFFNDSFAFLFWDLDGGEVLSATTEDWELARIGFDDLAPFVDR